MTIVKRNKLSLDYITASIADGLVIICDETPIALIYWDETVKNCYIKTISDRLQTYIVNYDLFIDFIYLVDEAFYRIDAEHNIVY